MIASELKTKTPDQLRDNLVALKKTPHGCALCAVTWHGSKPC
jgi:hypothetical protein